MKTNRGMVKAILLSMITCGIYAIFFWSGIGEDINIIASKRDQKKTMHYCLLFFLVGPITLGIAYVFWFHRISARIGEELRARNIDYSFGAGSFWGWNVLGSLILVGPFVYLHKICKAMNLLVENYLSNGENNGLQPPVAPVYMAQIDSDKNQ